jgi:hypothetical protein
MLELDELQRTRGKERKHINIQRPDLPTEYNQRASAQAAEQNTAVTAHN